MLEYILKWFIFKFIRCTPNIKKKNIFSVFVIVTVTKWDGDPRGWWLSFTLFCTNKRSFSIFVNSTRGVEELVAVNFLLLLFSHSLTLAVINDNKTHNTAYCFPSSVISFLYFYLLIPFSVVLEIFSSRNSDIRNNNKNTTATIRDATKVSW